MADVSIATAGTSTGLDAGRLAPASRRRATVGLVIGLTLMALLVLVAVVAPLVLSGPANTLSPDANQAASGDHVLGTDGLGHDMLARTLVATRLTLVMTVSATAISVVLGILVGVALWLSPPRLREAGLRVVEIAVTYPALLIAFIIASIAGQGAVSAVVAIGVAGIPMFARLTANLTAGVAQREFVGTARLLGVSAPRIAARHILPNMAEPLLILTASSFATTLVELSGLSFVGLGVQPPSYDFGYLLNDALPNIYTRPEQVAGPAAMIVLTGLAAMLIGDGLAASANPRSRARLPRTSRKALVDAVVSTALDDGTLLTVTDLTVRTAAGLPLVKGVSFTIRRGEILGVVGESGSGKSLTAMTVAKLLPDGLVGEAKVLQLDDIDLRGRVEPSRMASAVGLVYQDPGTTFSPARRMGSQLSDVLRTHRGMSAPTASARLREGFQAVQITEPERRLHQRPHELSGGMLQRAMIASSLTLDPLLVIADEPTTALDVTVQKEILTTFRRTSRDRDAAMLFISHDIGVVRALCDRVVVMHDGQILEEVAAADLHEDRVAHPYTRQLLAATPQVVRPTATTPDGPAATVATMDGRQS